MSIQHEVRSFTDWMGAQGRPVSLEGATGIYRKGMRWDDYAEIFTDRERPYAQALRMYLLRTNNKECGDWHHSDVYNGVPVFADGSVAKMSLRAWAEFQAAIWSTNDGCDYEYFDFYMDEPEEFYDGTQASPDEQ